MNEIDRPAIRAAGDRYFDIGADIWRFAARLDERPCYLSALDWGYSGGGKETVVAKYDGIRGGVRDFLRDGVEAMSELREVLYRAASTQREHPRRCKHECGRSNRWCDCWWWGNTDDGWRWFGSHRGNAFRDRDLVRNVDLRGLEYLSGIRRGLPGEP